MNLNQHLKAAFEQKLVIQFANSMNNNRFADTQAMAGVCQELCWKWLKRLKRQPLLYSNADTRMNAFFDKQKTIVKAMDRHNHQAKNLHRYPFEYYGFLKSEVNTIGLDKHKTIENWQKEGGGIFIMFLMSDGNLSHAIAAYKFPNNGASGWHRKKVLCFDPNYGEYEINPGDINGWLRTLLVEKYGCTELAINTLWHLKP
mgnify:CR=1 FL=1